MNRYQRSSMRANTLAFANCRRLESKIVKQYQKQLNLFCIRYYKLIKPALNKDGEVDISKFRKLKNSYEFRKLTKDLIQHANTILIEAEEADIDDMLSNSYDEVVEEIYSLFEKEKHSKPLLTTPWTRDGKNYRQRVITNRTNLSQTLADITLFGVLNGFSFDKQKKEYEKVFNKGINNTLRLVRTETEAIYTRGLVDSYTALGFITVSIFNEGANPCDFCENIDGEVITTAKLGEAEIGIDLPPYHPNCRCLFSIDEE